MTTWTDDKEQKLFEAQEAITQLKEELVDAKIDKANAERHRDNMFAENAELLEALESMIEYAYEIAPVGPDERIILANQAIRKARGE